MQAYLTQLQASKVTRARAREVIADELRRAALKAQLAGAPITPWTVDQETKALETLVCAQDDLPPVRDVRFAAFLPFLARP